MDLFLQRRLLKVGGISILAIMLVGCARAPAEEGAGAAPSPAATTQLPDRSDEVCSALPISMNQPQGDSQADYMLPETFEDLVADSDVILLGTIGALVRQGRYQGYDSGGNLIESSAPASLPFYDYALTSQQTLKDDRQESGPRILRLLEPAHVGPIDSGALAPPLAPNESYLMFLRANPDNATYGFQFLSGRLALIEDGVRFTDGHRTPLLLNGQQVSTATILSCISGLGLPLDR